MYGGARFPFKIVPRQHVAKGNDCACTIQKTADSPTCLIPKVQLARYELRSRKSAKWTEQPSRSDSGEVCTIEMK